MILVPVAIAVAISNLAPGVVFADDEGAAIAVGLMVTVFVALTSLVGSALDRGERNAAEQRRALEAALRASEADFRTLAIDLPVAVMRRDAAGEVVFANDHFRELYAMPPDQPVSSIDETMFHPSERERFLALAQRTRATGEPFQTEIRVAAPEGVARWVVLRARGQVDEDGNQTGYLSTSLDITQRRATEEALRTSEQLHRLTMSNLPDAIVGLYDRDLRCLLIEGAERTNTTVAMSTEACRGLRVAEFAGEAFGASVEPGMRAALRGESNELEYLGPTGILTRITIAPFTGDDDAIEGVLMLSTDITEARRREVAERQASEQFAVAFDQAPIGLAMIDLGGRFTRVNAAMMEMTGFTAGEFSAMPALGLVHPDDLESVRSSSQDEDGQDATNLRFEHRVIHADGRTFWMEVRVTRILGADGRPTHSIGQFMDVTERRGYEARLQHLAIHDSLTGLLNRRGFEERLEQQMAQARRYGHGGALLMLDLDGFKAVNDNFGHARGDALLVGVGEALAERLRETDVVARLGGDEFAVILPHEREVGARVVAESLLKVVSGRAQDAGLKNVTVSIGVAIFDPALSAEETLHRGDLTMYDAKNAGKNQYALVSGDRDVAAPVTP